MLLYILETELFFHIVAIHNPSYKVQMISFMQINYISITPACVCVPKKYSLCKIVTSQEPQVITSANPDPYC